MFHPAAHHSTAFLEPALNINMGDERLNVNIYRTHTCARAGRHYVPDHLTEHKPAPF